MNLPADFTRNILGAFGENGRDWLFRLPELIDETSQRWNLAEVRQVSNLSYNFVAFAKQNGGDVILKIGVPNPELVSEMNALRFFNGDGTCQLLACDEGKGFLLLERLQPGMMLSELEDDDKRTHIAIDVMEKNWRPMEFMESDSLLSDVQQRAAGLQKFIQLTDWFDGLKEIRPMFDGGTGPIPEKLLERVEATLPGLFAEGDVRLLHGDFHHFNILSSERGWLAIDPKGVIGPAGYEIGPLMLNPWIKPMDRDRFKVQAKRRVDILRERLGWEREKTLGWALAHSILSAYWDLELDPEYSIEAARIFSEL